MEFNVSTLHTLNQTGAIYNVLVCFVDDSDCVGWQLEIQLLNDSLASYKLLTVRNNIRCFKTLDAVFNFIEAECKNFKSVYIIKNDAQYQLIKVNKL